VQRLLDGAAFLFRSVPFLLIFEKSEHAVCFINSVELCSVKVRNIAQFFYSCRKFGPRSPIRPVIFAYSNSKIAFS
jgi:hypothetical protein